MLCLSYCDFVVVLCAGVGVSVSCVLTDTLACCWDITQPTNKRAHMHMSERREGDS